jgi:hypothetical protein
MAGKAWQCPRALDLRDPGGTLDPRKYNLYHSKIIYKHLNFILKLTRQVLLLRQKKVQLNSQHIPIILYYLKTDDVYINIVIGV